MSAASDVLAGLDEVHAWQENLYRDLHQHAELSHQEHATASKVAERLEKANYRVQSGVGGTGVMRRR